MLTGEALHRELVARLGARQPAAIELPLCAPIEHHGGVIEWSPSHGTFFFRVVGDRVIHAGVGRDVPSAQTDALVRWLAALDPRVLDRVSEERPVRYLEGSPLPPFSGHAIVHASLTRAAPSPLVTELLAGRTYRVLLVHRSEIAEDMDARWAKAQLVDLRGGPERAPCSAFQFARSKPHAKKTPARGPGRPQGLSGIASIVKTGDVVELENAWRHRLRLARTTATWLDANESRAFVGLGDANAIARAFVDRDEILREAAPRDVLEPSTLYDQLEAGARDLTDDGTEPVDLVERTTGGLVARLFVRRGGGVLHVRYELLDERLGEGHVRPLLEGPYLHVLTRHHDRGKASTIVLEPLGGVGARFEYPYPEGPRR
jgi:hypothetical protein